MNTHATGQGAMRSPDTYRNYKQTVALVLVTFAGALTFSGYGLVTFAADNALPLFLGVVIVLMLDVPILAYTRAAMIQAWRGQKRARGLAIFGVAILAGVSSLVNFVHAADKYGLNTASAVVLVILFAGAPWIVLLSTEVWVGLVTRTRAQALAHPDPEPEPVQFVDGRGPVKKRKPSAANKRAADPTKAGLPGYSVHGVKMGRPKVGERL